MTAKCSYFPLIALYYIEDNDPYQYTEFQLLVHYPL